MKHVFWLLIMTVSGVQGSESIWFYDLHQDRIETEQLSQQVRPIASITKIMTAMIALDHDPDLARKLPLSRLVHSHLPNRNYTRAELFDAMLVKSDNAAAETLAQDYPGGRHKFIQAMNDRAQQLKLHHTQFQDASGLGSGNVSTAREIGQLIQAGANYDMIRQAASKQQMAIKIQRDRRVRVIEFLHTNRNLMMVFDHIIVGKTGLTSAAGWCVALLVQQGQSRWVIVVLGSQTRQARQDAVKQLVHDHTPVQ